MAWRRLLAGALLAAALTAGSVAAAAIEVPARAGALARLLAAAGAGDTLRLAAGVHRGPVTIGVPLTLTGEPGAIIDAGGTGSVITVAAPDVVVRGLRLRNSGRSLDGRDSGVFLGREADRALIAHNVLEGNLFGVYVWGPDNAVVRGNRILGRADLHMSERGDGVSVWNSPGSVIEDNDIRHGRDGIFTNVSRDNLFRANRFRDLRFGVHYMYTNDSAVLDNISQGNHVGYALMYSKGLTVTGNLSTGDRDHGIALNYANDSHISGNAVRGGAGKCVFIYNSNYNAFLRNRFEGCGIGIHFTAGSEKNTITGNAFIGNETQVKYVGTRHLDWSHDRRGNYWSDNPAFDLDRDGIADTAYRPNDLVDRIMWTHPLAKLLLNSPAVQVVRWAQRQFPGLHPGGVIDSAPLMNPPAIELRE